MAIHPSAVIEAGARIHASAEIGPFCVVGPKVSIWPGTKLIQIVTVVGPPFAAAGQGAFGGGASRVNRDAPPYMILQGMSGEVRGVNSIGLKRRGLKPEAINCLKEAYRIIWRSQLPKPEALAEVEKM